MPEEPPPKDQSDPSVEREFSLRNCHWCSNGQLMTARLLLPFFVGIHELPLGSPSFRPHPINRRTNSRAKASRNEVDGLLTPCSMLPLDQTKMAKGVSMRRLL